MPVISPLDAIVLGIVEGLTEFLPVSSTGHLILTTHLLGLNAASNLDEGQLAGIHAFDIVIQSGALLAIVGIYFKQVRDMIDGLLGRNPQGRALLLQLLVAFFPAVFFGLLAGDFIKAHLFGVQPVVLALFLGGLLMIAVDFWRARNQARRGVPPAERPADGMTLDSMTLRAALLIGLAQCLAMWPGTSRSMVTIVAALLLGFSPRAAAQFSFLLALPTLGAATAHDALKHADELLLASGYAGLALGFATSCAVAWLAVKGFIAFLNRRGMWPFGVYRILLALVVAALLL